MSFSLRKKKISDREASYLVCDPLAEAGFIHAFGTRLCEARDPQWLLSAIEANDRNLALAHQIHSDVRLHIKERPALEGDALIVEESTMLVGIKTADCVPVLIGDPRTGVLAAVHAGWRGTLRRITKKTMKDLEEKLGVSPGDCIAAVGPCACGACYEVGEDVAVPFKTEFKSWPSFLKEAPVAGKFLFDGAKANSEQLLEAGLKPENIHTAPYCTIHNNDLFFSHRREGKTNNELGRMLSLIGKA